MFELKLSVDNSIVNEITREGAAKAGYKYVVEFKSEEKLTTSVTAESPAIMFFISKLYYKGEFDSIHVLEPCEGK